MTRETKAGLLMILMLSGVFGFMVYKRMQHPAAAMAQQNTPEEQPAESSTSKDSTDPFQTDELDRQPNRVITAAASTPARIPEDDPAPADSPNVKSSATAKDSFGQFQSTNRSKPKLPTSVDDEFGAQPNRRQEVAAAPASTGDDAFDPFSGGDAPQPKTLIKAAKTEVANDADPFDTPAIDIPAKAARPVEMSIESNPKVGAQAVEQRDPFDTKPTDSNDGFEAPVVLKEAPREIESKSGADPFDSAGDLEIQRPAKSTANRAEVVPSANNRREILAEKQAEIAEFEVQIPSKSKTLPEPSIDDPFDSQPAKSSVPSLTIPSRDAAPVREPLPARNMTPTREIAKPVDDGRFGGFVPATAKDATANAFSDQRPATPTASNAPAERRMTRPAPVTQIDEDFRASATRPLVAGDTYDIEPGDNFWTISRKKYGTGRYFMALAQHNSQVITDPKRMKLGVSISTPAAEVLERTYAQFIPKAATIDPVQTASIAPVSSFSSGTKVTVAAATDEAEAGFFIADDGTPMYRIGREDTLSGVAQRHLGRSSRWTQIFELNRDVLPDGNSLKIGAVLRLPADASRVDVVERGRTFR